MMTAPELELMSSSQVCCLLKISRVTLWRWASAGDLVPIKLSSNVNRYRLVDVEAFLQRLERQAGSTRDQVVDEALELLAEHHASELRPLCPACGRRRVNRGASQCSWCEEQAENDRRHKRAWWNEHGSAQRAERAKAAREEDTACG